MSLSVRRDGAATWITLDRPDALNALDGPVKEALAGALGEAAGDPGVRAVALTGAGRAFCVGQDLRELEGGYREGRAPDFAAELEWHYEPICRLLAEMPKPVVAAVNGVAAGAGASIAFACDFRILADTAGFNLAFAGVALSCDTGISWTLPRLIGTARAVDLLYFPRTVKAPEALELGLASSVVPADDLGTATAELAGRLAAGPTVAYGAIRRSVGYAATHTLAEALEFEGEQMKLTGDTEDHPNAVRSFVAKEKPVFDGR